MIEAAVIANRLRRQERLDLSCLVALALLRASAFGAHGREPLTRADWATGEQATGLFVGYASELFERCDDTLLEPRPFIQAHNELGFFVTYAVRITLPARVTDVADTRVADDPTQVGFDPCYGMPSYHC